MGALLPAIAIGAIIDICLRVAAAAAVVRSVNDALIVASDAARKW
jgi:hypothetical protein